jgi:hypothetical protein
MTQISPVTETPSYHELLTRLDAIHNLADAEDVAAWLMPLLQPRGVAQRSMRWVQRENKDCFPTIKGWYRVMVSGDSESIEGHTIYAFDDYETWAQFTPHEDGGSFVGTHDEDEYTIFAYCGPIVFPEYSYEEAAARGEESMAEFKQYRRKQIAELRPLVEGDDLSGVSISAEDRKAGSPKLGDMIARNPKNHADQWLVAAQYFADNFEPV